MPKSGVQDSSPKEAVSKTVEGVNAGVVIGWTVTHRRFSAKNQADFVVSCDISRLGHRIPGCFVLLRRVG
jgi:hypothetical protein